MVLHLALQEVQVGQDDGEGEAVHQAHRELLEVNPQVVDDVETPAEDCLPLQTETVVGVVVRGGGVAYQDPDLPGRELVHHGVQQAILHVLQLLRGLLHHQPHFLPLCDGDVDSEGLDIMQDIAQFTYFIF